MNRCVAFPVAALSDPNLGARDLRVLAAICYFDPQKSGACTVKRNIIAGVARVCETYVSKATKRLVALGWLSEKIGNGGRQMPSTYAINWLYMSTINGGQFNHGLDAENGGQSSHGLDAENGGQSGHGLAVNGGQSGEGLETKTVASLATPNQITDNIYINTTDQIRSDDKKNRQNFGVDDAIKILVFYGMPLAYIHGDSDRKLISQWISNGTTAARIQAACQRASVSKNDGKPFGPRYIDKVLNSLAEEILQNGGSKASNGAHAKRDYASGNW